MNKGILLAIEAGDKLGKTTQYNLALVALSQCFPNYRVVGLREPGGTIIGEWVRLILLSKNLQTTPSNMFSELRNAINPELVSQKGLEFLLSVEAMGEASCLNSGGRMDACCEAMLFQASRAQLYSECVLPLLQQGAVVLLDRCGYSSDVYQGIVRGLGLEIIELLNRMSTRGRYPDLTILIDLPPEKAEEWLAQVQRKGKEDRLDNESLDFHRRVYEGYHSLPTLLPEALRDSFRVIDMSRFLHLPAQDSISLIHAEIMGHFKNYINLHRGRLETSH